MYQRKCIDCPLKHVGQTGQLFIPDIRSTYRQLGITAVTPRCSTHILSTEHAYRSITDNENYENREKGKASEYIGELPYIWLVETLHMNDAHIDIYNPIFEKLQELNTR
jgi:hypothetical protein